MRGDAFKGFTGRAGKRISPGCGQEKAGRIERSSLCRLHEASCTLSGGVRDSEYEQTGRKRDRCFLPEWHVIPSRTAAGCQGE